VDWSQGNGASQIPKGWTPQPLAARASCGTQTTTQARHCAAAAAIVDATTASGPAWSASPAASSHQACQRSPLGPIVPSAPATTAGTVTTAARDHAGPRPALVVSIGRRFQKAPGRTALVSMPSLREDSSPTAVGTSNVRLPVRHSEMSHCPRSWRASRPARSNAAFAVLDISRYRLVTARQLASAQSYLLSVPARKVVTRLEGT
jgi:hypothetical protein